MLRVVRVGIFLIDPTTDLLVEHMWRGDYDIAFRNENLIFRNKVYYFWTMYSTSDEMAGEKSKFCVNIGTVGILEKLRIRGD